MAIDERAWPAPTAWVRWILIVASAALLGCSGGGSGGGSGTPGITRSLTSSTLSLSEGGAAQTFSFALNSAPTADVVITITTGEKIVATPAEVTFNASNWNAPQDITIAAVDNTIAEGAHSDVIQQAVTSSDSRYGVLTLSDIAVNITDNDTPGVTVSESNGGTQVTEGGADDNYTVILNSQPANDVVITITGDSQLNITPSTLTFTTFNWNLPQTVTVSAVDDGDIEGGHSATIAHSSSSSDVNYNGVTIGSVTAQIIDNATVATMEFIGDDAVLREGDGRISIPVRLRLNAPVTIANPVSATITVLASSTVRNNVDVTPLASGVTFSTGSGAGATQIVTLDIADDALAESVETIDLQLTDANGLGAALGNQVDYRIHLHDNELPQLIASSVTAFAGYSVSNLLGIDTSNAAVRRLSGAGLAGFSAIGGLAYDATAGALYAVSNGELVKIDVYTGVGSVVGPTVVTMGLAFDAVTGLLYGSDGAHLYRINTTTAATTAIGAFGAYSDVEGLAYNGNVLYGSDTTANVLLIINKSTGSASPVGSLGVTGLASLVYSMNTLYAASTTQHKLYTVNTTTGAASAVGAQPLGYNNVIALSTTANAGTLYGFDTGTRQIITIDRVSGVGQPYKMTSLGNSFGVQLAGMTYDATHQVYYGVAANPAGEQYLLHIHAATGTATSIAKITGVSGTLFDLAYDDNSGTLYGVNGGSLYRIDAASGATGLVGDTHGNPHGLAFDAENNILYASDANTAQLLTLDTTTGAGTAKGAALLEDMSGALAYDSTHNKLYGANKLGLLRLDTANGRGTSVGQLGLENVPDVAYNPNSGVVYAEASDGDDGKLLTVDLATGTATPVGGIGIACCVDGLAFIPASNLLYAVDTASGDLVRISTDTGVVTTVGPIGFDRIAGALAYDPVGQKLYGIGGTATGGSGVGPYSYQLITINPNTGVGTPVAAVSYENITALAFDPAATKLYGYDATTTQLLTIDTATGAGTTIGQPGYDIRGLTWRY